MEIFFSVGEPSGDQHAAHLMEEIRRQRPDAVFTGFGGPEMEREGCRLLFRLTDLAVMFIWSVVPLLFKFYRLVRQAKHHFRDSPPDAVVLIDFPGFNWWIARKAKKAGIPVYYYLPPQLWAWGTWRVRKMRKFVDHILCGLPFEPAWYAQRGMQAEYVGHPFFDEIAAYQLDGEFRKEQTSKPGRIVGVLPGSRNKEIEHNWTLMISVMRQLYEKQPDVRFLVASYNEKQRGRCEELLHEAEEKIGGEKTEEGNSEKGKTEEGKSGGLTHPARRLPVQFFVGKTSEIIDAAECCLMVSGSVSLEMLHRTTPAAVVYRVNPIARFLIQRLLLQIDTITLPNLIAGSRLFPEWVVCANPQREIGEMAATLADWLNDPQKRNGKVREMADLKNAVVQTGAARKTTAAILKRLPSPLSSRAA